VQVRLVRQVSRQLKGYTEWACDARNVSLAQLASVCVTSHKPRLVPLSRPHALPQILLEWVHLIFRLAKILGHKISPASYRELFSEQSDGRSSQRCCERHRSGDPWTAINQVREYTCSPLLFFLIRD
jgi:hypothetical protein